MTRQKRWLALFAVVPVLAAGCGSSPMDRAQQDLDSSSRALGVSTTQSQLADAVLRGASNARLLTITQRLRQQIRNAPDRATQADKALATLANATCAPCEALLYPLGS